MMCCCDECPFLERIMAEYKDTDDAIRALEESGACDACYEMEKLAEKERGDNND